MRFCTVCSDCLSSSSEAWEADSDLDESSQVVSDLIPQAPEDSIYFQAPKHNLRGSILSSGEHGLIGGVTQLTVGNAAWQKEADRFVCVNVDEHNIAASPVPTQVTISL